MATINKRVKVPRVVERTFEGAPATVVKNPALKLRRLVMANLLWEDQFYIDGQSTAKLIEQLVPQVDPVHVAEIAVTARERGKLRHVPLLLVREMARQFSKVKFAERNGLTAELPIAYLGHKGNSSLVSDTLEKVIQRPDELTEFLALYWRDGKQTLSAQVKKGLARAFSKFSEYQLAKYNRDGAVRLRDVMFLTHPTPRPMQEGVYKRVAENKMEAPDTWETELSAGKDKRETFTRLIQEQKLGALALLRNLRNMQEAGVDRGLIKQALAEMKVERVLPYRFIAAEKFAPTLSRDLELAMFRSLDNHPKLKGTTLLLVDVSGSMGAQLSGKSDMTRLDAACGLAILLNEIGEDVQVATFSDYVKVVPSRGGFALRDEIVKSQPHSGTDMGRAVEFANNQPIDRLIVITDEQSHTSVPNPKAQFNYIINVGAYQNGVGVGGKWDKVDGFSEAVVDYIMNLEEEGLNLQEF